MTAIATAPAPTGRAAGRRTLGYILSPSYSGSTLLTFLLANHARIATIGELKASAMGDIETYDCSCGQRIRQCEFWAAVTAELRRRGHTFDLAAFGTDLRLARGSFADKVVRARLRGSLFEAVRQVALRLLPGCAAAVRTILERNAALVDAVCTVQGRDIFLDGSKDPIRLGHMLRHGAWDIRVIYLIRDGRGAACSYQKHTRCGMAQAALEWRRTHEQCDRVVRALPPGSWLRLRYEDLCREPEARLAECFALLGVDPAQAEGDLAARPQHILGNAMRLRNSREIRLDEKWRTQLTADDLAAFESVAGALNRAYGYA